MSPRWLELFDRDVREAARDRSLYAMVAFFGLLGVAFGYLHVDGAGPDTTGPELLVPLTVFFLFLVPLAAVVGGFEAVVGMRDDGSLKLVLGLPYSRLDFLLGTYLGRLAFVVVPTAAAFLLAHGVALVLDAPVAPGDAATLFALVGLLGLAFVGIAVGISAGTLSRTRAAAAAFGLFLSTIGIWDPIVRMVVYVANGFQSPSTTPEWANVLLAVNPTTAFRTAVHGWIPVLSAATFGGPPGSGESAFYQDPAFGAAVLVAWGILVPAVGYIRFRRADV